MAECPRCAVPVPPYTRCESCGLVLGFDGITVLIEYEQSRSFDRVRMLARRQPSCSEWAEENGRRFLRVTYSIAELDGFRQIAAAAGKLSRKHSFINGLEICWPAEDDWRLPRRYAAVLSPSPRQHRGRASSVTH